MLALVHEFDAKFKRALAPLGIALRFNTTCAMSVQSPRASSSLLIWEPLRRPHGRRQNQTGGQDRARISLSEDYEVRDWSRKFGVTPEQLRAAVQAVGSLSKDVEAHLQRNR